MSALGVFQQFGGCRPGALLRLGRLGRAHAGSPFRRARRRLAAIVIVARLHALWLGPQVERSVMVGVVEIPWLAWLDRPTASAADRLARLDNAIGRAALALVIAVRTLAPSRSAGSSSAASRVRVRVRERPGSSSASAGAENGEFVDDLVGDVMPASRIGQVSLVDACESQTRALPRLGWANPSSEVSLPRARKFRPARASSQSERFGSVRSSAGGADRPPRAPLH